MATKTELLKRAGAAWTGEIPGYETVILRELTGDDNDFIYAPGDDGIVLSRMIVCAVCNGEGTNTFDRTDAPLVNKAFGMRKLKAYAEVINRECGLGIQPPGNSKPTTPQDSGTD